jgi:hypothetical protein
MDGTSDARQVGLGILLLAARAGQRIGRAALGPAQLALKAPLVGPPLRRTTEALAFDGRDAVVRARVWFDVLVADVVAAPELERAIDRALAGPLTDGVARSLVEHRVVERVAGQVVAGDELDRLVSAVLEDPRTERMLANALASPGLERLVVHTLDSRFAYDLTDRVLDSAELQRVIEHVARSPELLAAVTRHTETLADEMVGDVRRRTQRVDDAAERVVRGWLRRTRPNTT